MPIKVLLGPEEGFCSKFPSSSHFRFIISIFEFIRSFGANTWNVHTGNERKEEPNIEWDVVGKLF